MKIIGVSFFWGIAATIILSVTLFSIAIYDTAYHRIHNIIKYLFFILIGILLIIFSLLFTVTGGTDILLVLRDIDIYYDKEIAFIFAIFTCWSLFIIMRYYGYVLMPEYSNLNKELRFKISRKTIYLSFCTLIAELIILWWCWPILAYVIDIILLRRIVMKFIGLVGTNSKRSTNRQLLQYIKKHFADKAEIELVEIKDLPVFNKPANK